MLLVAYDGVIGEQIYRDIDGRIYVRVCLDRKGICFCTSASKKNHWQPEYFYLGDRVTFESIGLTISVEEIYDRVDNADMNEFRISGSL